MFMSFLFGICLVLIVSWAEFNWCSYVLYLAGSLQAFSTRQILRKCQVSAASSHDCVFCVLCFEVTFESMYCTSFHKKDTDTTPCQQQPALSSPVPPPVLSMERQGRALALLPHHLLSVVYYLRAKRVNLRRSFKCALLSTSQRNIHLHYWRPIAFQQQLHQI